MESIIQESEIILTTTSTSTYAHYYYIDKVNNTAKCKMCLVNFEYNLKKTGTKSLGRHLNNKHPNVALAKEEAKESNNSGIKSSDLTTYWNKDETKKRRLEPEIKKCISTLICSKHILPLNFFEDPVISRGFGLPYINSENVRKEIKRSAIEMKKNLMEENIGEWATIAIDGWKNPVTQHKHLNIILFFLSKNTLPIFLRSFVIESNTANIISEKVLEVLNDLDKYKIVVVGCIADNAKCMIAAMELIFEKRPTVMPLRCASHVINLIIKDSLHSVKFLAKSLECLTEFINRKEIKRYCPTRWNSVFDRFKDLSKYLLKLNNPENSDKLDLIDGSIIALTPFIDILNKSQEDGAGWPEFYKDFCNSITKTSDRGFNEIVDIAEIRKKWIKNPIVCFYLYLNNMDEIDDDVLERLYKWTDALNIPDFRKYSADREFNSNPVLSRRLKLFLNEKIKSIAISEASVERCFSAHKLIHTPLRASLTDDLVEDILYIRYNTKMFENVEIDEQDLLEIENLLTLD